MKRSIDIDEQKAMELFLKRANERKMKRFLKEQKVIACFIEDQIEAQVKDQRNNKDKQELMIPSEDQIAKERSIKRADERRKL